MSKHDQTLKPEQIEIARWTASLGAITAEALAMRLDIATASARGQLAAARRRGLLSRYRPLAGRPSLFTVTRSGLRMCGERGIQMCLVSPSNANHLIACAAVAASLERCYPGHRVMGERELRRDEREHGTPLASAELAGSCAADARRHHPDLVIWPNGPDAGLPVPVEVELTIKAPRRLLEICNGWARSRTVAGVLYVAPANVRRALSRALTEALADERIAVVPLEALPGMEVHAS